MNPHETFRAALEGRVAISSSGDPEQDQRDLRAHLRHSANRAEGLCPNGCAPLHPMIADEKMLAAVPSLGLKVGDEVPGTELCDTCGYVGMIRSL